MVDVESNSLKKTTYMIEYSAMLISAIDEVHHGEKERKYEHFLLVILTDNNYLIR